MDIGSSTFGQTKGSGYILPVGKALQDNILSEINYTPLQVVSKINQLDHFDFPQTLVIATMARKAVPVEKLTAEHLGDFGKVIDGAGSPLACVAVVGALLEQWLMTLLHAFFIEHKETERLFDFNGPLDSVSKCSRLAFCLGLFPEPVFNNLTKIGQIRNLFAHSVKILDFDTKEIAKLCKELTAPDFKGMMARNMESLKQFGTPETLIGMFAKLDMRNRFNIIATFVLMYIMIRCKSTSRVETTTQPFLW